MNKKAKKRLPVLPLFPPLSYHSFAVFKCIERSLFGFANHIRELSDGKRSAFGSGIESVAGSSFFSYLLHFFPRWKWISCCFQERCHSLLFNGFDNQMLGDFLTEYRKAGIEKINLKATITPYNLSWNSLQLRDELNREHEELTGNK